MSPELIAPQRFGLKKSRPTKPSDCYALGMVIYETISGNLPFHEHTDLTVCMKVLEGERPPRGVRFTECLWKLLELCWTWQPNSRPTIEEVLQRLEMVSDSPEPPSFRVDDELEEDCGDWDSASGSSGVDEEMDGDGDDRDSANGSSGLSKSIMTPVCQGQSQQMVDLAQVEQLSSVIFP